MKGEEGMGRSRKHLSSCTGRGLEAIGKPGRRRREGGDGAHIFNDVGIRRIVHLTNAHLPLDDLRGAMCVCRGLARNKSNISNTIDNKKKTVNTNTINNSSNNNNNNSNNNSNVKNILPLIPHDLS
jgi:hypothetical protein